MAVGISSSFFWGSSSMNLFISFVKILAFVHLRKSLTTPLRQNFFTRLWMARLLSATLSCSNCWTIDGTEYPQEYNKTILLASMDKCGIVMYHTHILYCMCMLQFSILHAYGICHGYTIRVWITMHACIPLLKMSLACMHAYLRTYFIGLYSTCHISMNLLAIAM